MSEQVAMTVEQAIEFARVWQKGLTVYPGAMGWRVVCMVLADEVERLQARVAELESQLPEEMKHCTIIFKECDKGHGWLTATNWVQHGCPKCEFDRIVDEKHELQRLRRQSSNMVSALHLEACQWRLKAEKAEQERDGLAAKCAELLPALEDAIEYLQNILPDEVLIPHRAAIANAKANQIEREGGV